MAAIPHSKTYISSTEKKNVSKVLSAGLITSGQKSELFLTNLRAYFQEDRMVLYSSGSSALYNILISLNIKINDEVLLPNYICQSVLNCIRVVGATPVFYDNGKETWVSSENEIKSRISKQTKVIIINHVFGIFNSTAKKLSETGIHLIEDCCHFFVKSSLKMPVSKYSLASFYSFNSTKLLSTGEGGAILTNNSSFYKELLKNKIDNPISDLNASLGIIQLSNYNFFLERRSEIALFFDNSLKDYDIYKNKKSSIFFRYPIRVKESQQINFLKSKKVNFRKGVDCLLNSFTEQKDNEFPNSSIDFNQTVSIPIYPALKKNELNKIMKETKKILDA